MPEFILKRGIVIMREQYWAFYCSIKYKSFYYEYFQLLFNKINWGITALCTLTALSCVAV